MATLAITVKTLSRDSDATAAWNTAAIQELATAGRDPTASMAATAISRPSNCEGRGEPARAERTYRPTIACFPPWRP